MVGTEGETFEPRSRVGAVVVALINGDADGAEEAAGQPAQEHDGPVLSAALRLAVRSLFDEDTPAESVAAFVSGIAPDVEVDPAVAEALIRTQLGEDHLLDGVAAQEVSDTTWSMLGYLCERQLGPEESLQLMALAEREVLPTG